MSTHRKETRAFRRLETRALSDSEKKAGYIGAIRSAIPYSSDSGEIRERGANNGRPFTERIAPGAFARSLEKPGDIMAFAGHTDDPLASLARAGAGLTFSDTADGLQWEALVPDTTACRDLLNLIESGVIKGASFEFAIRGADGERWEKRDGRDIRTITDAQLFAVNPVAWPAYEDSALTVAMRSRSERGVYAYAYNDAYEAPITDRSYAEQYLADEMACFSRAQSYLRANPQGAHVELATRSVADCAAEIKTLLDWLAANGATPDESTVAAATEQMRAASAAPTFHSACDRERRYRLLQLRSS